MQNLLTYVATIVAVAAIVVRYVRVLSPVLAWLPPKWRWVPAAVSAAAASLIASLPDATDSVGVIEAIISAAVLFALAAQAGLHAPEQPADAVVTPSAIKTVSKVGPALMLVLLFSAGCAPSLQASMAARAPERVKATPAEQAKCRRLSSTEQKLRWTQRLTEAMAGGTGLVSIAGALAPNEAETEREREARRAATIGLGVTAAVAGVVSVTTGSLRAEAGADFVKECGQ